MHATIRPATQDDVDQIVALNQLCYPHPDEQDVVWTADQLRGHLRAFLEGQLVAERDGEVVGAASSLIISLGRDPYRMHTWAGATDDGTFYNHDPYGDTLYCADITVHPDHRRKGVARALYEARQQICRRMNLRRMVAGGRLEGLRDHPESLGAEEYARRVEAKEIEDQVLSAQMAVGFQLRGVLPNYLPDPQSGDHATFLEWLNPNYRRRAGKARSLRVSCVQYRMRKINSFDDFSRQVKYFVDTAAGYKADFVVFPELLTAQLMSFIDVKTAKQAIVRLTDYTEQVDALFTGLATDLQVGIVGGTHPMAYGDKILNVATMYLPDGRTYRQPKIHITPNERRSWGIDGGNSLQVIDTQHGKVAMLVCYDIEFPEAARYLADQGAEVIFLPFCTDDRQAYLRVRYCAQARAVENQIYVACAGTVGNLPDAENMDIQYAQSAVFAPSDFSFARDGILVEASVNTETIITTDLDLEALEEAINMGSVRPRRDRRPDLFRYLATLGED